MKEPYHGALAHMGHYVEWETEDFMVLGVNDDEDWNSGDYGSDIVVPKDEKEND